jgi:hypothetical protein
MLSKNRKLGRMDCPYCHRSIDDKFILSYAQKLLAKRRRTPRDPKVMSELGKKGAAKRWGKKPKKS